MIISDYVKESKHLCNKRNGVGTKVMFNYQELKAKLPVLGVRLALVKHLVRGFQLGDGLPRSPEAETRIYIGQRNSIC